MNLLSKHRVERSNEYIQKGLRGRATLFANGSVCTISVHFECSIAEEQRWRMVHVQYIVKKGFLVCDLV